MTISDEILVEDWLGLESETERLLMVYGYPVEEPCGFVLWVNAETDESGWRETNGRDRRQEQAVEL